MNKGALLNPAKVAPEARAATTTANKADEIGIEPAMRRKGVNDASKPNIVASNMVQEL